MIFSSFSCCSRGGASLEKPGKGVNIAGAREKGSYCWLARLDSYRARDELFDRWED